MKRALCILLFALALPAGAQEEGGLERARERWEAMSSEERAEMLRRFEELRSMDAGRRRDLEERYERLRSAERTAVDEMPEPVRRRLDSLGPLERREVVREVARDALIERGRRAREHLPKPLRERLERAGPGEVPEVVQEMKRARRSEHLSRALDKLGRELGLSEAERDRLGELPLEQGEAKLLELHRQLVEQRVQRDGLPEWIEPEEWEGWRALPKPEFFERFERRRRTRGIPSIRGPFDPSRGRAEAEGEGDGEEPLRLGELLRPDPDWRIELRGLSPEQRRAEIGGRVKRRVLDFLEQRPGIIEPVELERLRGLEGEAFGEALREQLRGGAGRPRPGRSPSGGPAGRGERQPPRRPR